MRSVPLLLIVLVGVNTDDYLDEMQNRCYASRRKHFCTKYQFFKYIDNYHLGNVSLTSDSSVRFVTLPSVNISEVPLFEETRQYVQEDSEFVKVVKYIKRRAAKFLQEQGFSLELPDEVDVLHEPRKVTGKGKKVKKTMLVPLIVLAKVFKIKILVSLIFLGVLAIKKMLLTAAFLLPGIIASIKQHCKAQQFHVVPYHVEEEHQHHSHEHEDHEFGGGYPVSGYGGGYGGEKNYWDKKKRHSYI